METADQLLSDHAGQMVTRESAAGWSDGGKECTSLMATGQWFIYSVQQVTTAR